MLASHSCRRALFWVLLLSFVTSAVSCRSNPSTSAQDSSVADTSADTAKAPDQAEASDVGSHDRALSADGPVIDADTAASPDSTPADQGVPDTVVSCAQLEAEFQQALDHAVECTVGCSCCLAKVIGVIYPGCPCPIFVNDQNTQAIADMEALRVQFAAQSCPGPTCKCKNPVSATCMQPPGAPVALCINTF